MLRTVGLVRPVLPLARALRAPTARYSTPAAPGDKDGVRGTPDAEAEARQKHLERLEKYYPPSLVKSVLAAESAVTREQWGQRAQPVREFAPQYADDYSDLDPFWDFAEGDWVNKGEPRQPVPPRVPQGETGEQDVMSHRTSPTAINLTQLEQLTGLRTSYLRTLVAKPLIRKRVVNMTRLGRTSGFYALAVVGDRNGYVGIGEGRDSKMISLAVARAHWEAAKNLVYIPRFEDRTIYGNIEHKKGAVIVNLRAAAPGSGLRVNHIIYEICRVAGIKDLVGNVYRSRNPMNVAKTALEALSTKQVLIDEIAASRGKRVVDVTNTYLNF